MSPAIDPVTRHIADLDAIAIPRWHGTEDGEVDLHNFVDASETATCATCYVVQDTSNSRVRSLCMAKCLFAPVKTKSIPRLELDAADTRPGASYSLTLLGNWPHVFLDGCKGRHLLVAL